MPSYHCSVKTGGKGRAGKHGDYISREGKYSPEMTKGNRSKLEDLEHTASGNMPAWASHDHGIFWRAADEHERANGATYREIEVALPRELNPAQRRELVEDFVRQQIGDRHPYTYAIHVPKAAIEKGEQPHAHIMYSERTLDGIARDPDLFFKRASPKTPEKGGCRKDSAGTKERLLATRELWADVQNRHLEKAGIAERVTHLSLKAQGIDRQPEKHLGPVDARQVNASALLEHRAAERELAQVPRVDAAAELASQAAAAQALAQREATAREAAQAQQARAAAEAAAQAEREAARQQAEARRQALEAAAEARARQEAREAKEAKARQEAKAKAEQQQKMAAGLVTEREQELAARTLAALQKDDHRELERCYMQAGALRREALQDLADASPQPVNALAIEHRIKQEQNDSARKSGDREPWAFEGPDQHLCRWDAAAKAAEKDLERHIKSDRPTGFFKRAETKAWDAQKDELARLWDGWTEAAARVKRELRTETAARLEKAEAVEARRAAQKAPEQALHAGRVGAIEELSKALETALKPHRERERQRDIDHGDDFGR